MYLADTYLTLIKREPSWDIHDTARIPLPPPEFYVVFTGRNDSVPEVVSLRRDFFQNDSAPIDLEARVIRDEGDDILGQYIVFCHVFDEQVKQYGSARMAAEETIRICRWRGALADYLAQREEEVIERCVTAVKS